ARISGTLELEDSAMSDDGMNNSPGSLPGRRDNLSPSPRLEKKEPTTETAECAIRLKRDSAGAGPLKSTLLGGTGGCRVGLRNKKAPASSSRPSTGSRPAFESHQCHYRENAKPVFQFRTFHRSICEFLPSAGCNVRSTSPGIRTAARPRQALSA